MHITALLIQSDVIILSDKRGRQLLPRTQLYM